MKSYTMGHILFLHKNVSCCLYPGSRMQLTSYERLWVKTLDSTVLRLFAKCTFHIYFANDWQVKAVSLVLAGYRSHWKSCFQTHRVSHQMKLLRIVSQISGTGAQNEETLPLQISDQFSSDSHTLWHLWIASGNEWWSPSREESRELRESAMFLSRFRLTPSLAFLIFMFTLVGEDLSFSHLLPTATWPTVRRVSSEFPW